MKTSIFLTTLGAVALLSLSPATSFASPIAFCDAGCTNPSSGFAPFVSQTQTSLSNFNADYSTPMTFALPANTTLVSFTLTPMAESLGYNFSIWYDAIDLNKRIFGANLNGAEFYGIVSDIPMNSIIVTTPSSGAPFRIENFMVGPTATAAETPEPATFGMIGAGLAAVGLTRRRFNWFQLRRKVAAWRGPKKAHVQAMRKILDGMDGRERLALLRYYCDNRTVEEIAEEFGVTQEWFRAMKAEARSRFGAAIKSPVRGSLGDLVAAA